MIARIIVTIAVFLFCISCAPRYSCNDKNTLDTVRDLSLTLLRRDYNLVASNLDVGLITLQSRNEKTGQITCNAQVNFMVTDQVGLDSFLRNLLSGPPSTGQIEYTVDQDQSNDLQMVIRVKLYQLQ